MELGSSPHRKICLAGYDSDNEFRWRAKESKPATGKPTDPSGTYNNNPTILPDKP